MAFVMKQVDKRFGDLVVLQDFSMQVEEHKLVCMVGPSGTGKTTLLNIMAGIIPADNGEINGFEGRTVSYLFQETRLLGWKTVKENIDFVLKDKLGKEQREKLGYKYLSMVGLWDFRDYYPRQLSGGMKQRVSIARAFAYPADLLLMDEPFTGLDIQLKTVLISAFIDLWLLDRRSVFFVTHDIEEAVLLGEEIYVLTDRPATIKGKVINTQPHRERQLQNDNMRSLQEEVLKLLQ